MLLSSKQPVGRSVLEGGTLMRIINVSMIHRIPTHAATYAVCYRSGLHSLCYIHVFVADCTTSQGAFNTWPQPRGGGGGCDQRIIELETKVKARAAAA